MADQNLRAIISILDRTAEPLHQINARIEAMGAPLRHIGDRLSVLAEETGLTRIGEHARDAFQHVRNLASGITGLIAPLLALGSAASVAGLIELVKSTAEFEKALYFGAKTANLSTEALAGWHYAAGLVNVDVERMDRGFSFLNRNIALAAMGKAKDVEQILAKMGFHNTPGHLVQTADALKAVSAEVKHLTESGQTELAEAMLSKLFGARAGAQLLPLFEEGPEELNRLFASAKLHGIAPSTEEAERGERFARSLEEMSAAALGLKLAIGEALYPVLTPVVQKMTEWVDANREWLATGIGDAIASVGETIRGIDWSGIVAGFKTLAEDAHWVVTEVGGVGHAILIIAGISLAPTILAFAQLAWAVGTTAVAFVLMPLAGFLATLISLVPAIDSAAAAMVAFDIAADANPIGAVVAAIGLLIAAGILLYEYWQPISTWFKDMWQGLPLPVQDALKLIFLVIDPFLALPLEIYQHWNELTPYFKALWAGVVAVFQGAWEAIKPIVEAIENAVGFIEKHLPSLGKPVNVGPAGESYDEYGHQIGAGTTPGPQSSSQYRGIDQTISDFLKANAPGQTKVTVDFKNLPPGVTVTTEHAGNPLAEVNIGRAFAY